MIYSESPATGDRGARQLVRRSGKNAAAVNSRKLFLAQDARVRAFVQRRRSAAVLIAAVVPPRTIAIGRSR
jgi:hypothetical protein